MSTSLDPIFLSVCYTIICSLEHWLLPRTHFAEEEEEEEEEEEGKKRRMLLLSSDDTMVTRIANWTASRGV
jgi:hypothetical protein